jgi:serine/threonine protein kinase
VAHLLEMIVKAEYTEFPKTFSKNLKDLLNNILVSNPYKRISLAKIIEHPWFLE